MSISNLRNHLKDHIKIVLMVGITLMSLFSIGVFIVAKPLSNRYYRIVPYKANDMQDGLWAGFMYRQITKRATKENVAILGRVKVKGKAVQKRIIMVDFNPQNKEQARTIYRNDTLHMIAKDASSMKWLVGQVIKMMGDDDGADINVDDMPPAYGTYGMDGRGNFEFEYRAIYDSGFLENKDFTEFMGLNDIEKDWGIWGHNLKKAISKDLNPSMFAKVNGVSYEDQFCFTSPALYKAVEKYILTNYGEKQANGTPVRFVIMPNDDPAACTCPRCMALGNSSNNATPAVTSFVVRLAKRFPNYQFFTSYYLSTAYIPSKKLPSNVGVLISAIDAPLQSDFVQRLATRSLANIIDRWCNVTNRVYVWDYCRNFDDYYTPFPCIYLLRERLQMYKVLGVKGVILNGSGDTYTTFNDIQKFVLSAMLINPNLDQRYLLRRVCKMRYPTSYKILEDYIFSLEDSAVARGDSLVFYGGIDDAVKAYLDPVAFCKFYSDLKKVAINASGQETKRLEYILTSLSFTRLELMRCVGGIYNEQVKDECLQALRAYEDLDYMTTFREANGNISDYINYISTHNINRTKNNLSIIKNSRLDEGSKSVSILVDGYEGIPYDYHTNWMLYSGDKLILMLKPLASHFVGHLSVGLLSAQPWHISLPFSVELWQNGKRLSSATPMLSTEDKFQRIEVRLSMSGVKQNIPFEIRIIKMGKKFAIDEIKITK